MAYPKYTLAGKTPAQTYENIVQYNHESASFVSGIGDTITASINLTVIQSISSSFATSASWAPSSSSISASFAATASHIYNSGSTIVTSDTSTLITTRTLLSSPGRNIIITPGASNNTAANVTMSAGISTGGIGGTVHILGGLGVAGGGDVSIWCGNAGGRINLKSSNGIDRLSLSGSVLTLSGSMNVTGSITSSLFGTASNSTSASWASTSPATTLITASTYEITSSHANTSSYISGSTVKIINGGIQVYSSNDGFWYNLTIYGVDGTGSIELNAVV